MGPALRPGHDRLVADPPVGIPFLRPLRQCLRSTFVHGLRRYFGPIRLPVSARLVITDCDLEPAVRFEAALSQGVFITNAIRIGFAPAHPSRGPPPGLDIRQRSHSRFSRMESRHMPRFHDSAVFTLTLPWRQGRGCPAGAGSAHGIPDSAARWPACVATHPPVLPSLGEKMMFAGDDVAPLP